MKKVFLSLVAFAFAMATYAQQLTLLHTFDERTLNGVYPYFSYHYNDYSYANSGESYIYVDENLNEQGYYSVEKDTSNYTYTYTRYNNDFTVKSKDVYNIPRVENYVLDWVNLYYNLFDDDASTVEILVAYRYKDDYGRYNNIRQKVILYNEVGNVLYDFGIAYYINVASWLHYLDNEFRLWVSYEYYYSDEEREQTGTYTYDLKKVFKVGKNSLTGLMQVPASALPYPNPARSNINIPLNSNGGTLNIYDLNGRRIQSIPANGDNINLNVSGYSSGQYIYEQNGNVNRFIVK